MYHRILLATDGSEHSQKALSQALELAQVAHAEVYIVHAYPLVSELLGSPAYDQLLGERVEAANQIVNKAGEPFEKAGLVVKREVLEGPPAEAILRVAGARQSDLIIVGARGASGLVNVVLGRIAQQVLQRATCPVLVIR